MQELNSNIIKKTKAEREATEKRVDCDLEAAFFVVMAEGGGAFVCDALVEINKLEAFPVL
jgi:hypothetical protein